jgi:hypothetical protein
VQTWLVIFRGDPVDGGVPIGVVNDPELCLAAVRSAWAAFRQLSTDERDDPVLREGAIGMEHRLRIAAEELERAAPPASSATGRERFRTPPSTAVCARPGCGEPIPTSARRRGSPQRFCSAPCRTLAWRMAHQHGGRSQGPTKGRQWSARLEEAQHEDKAAP